MKIRVFAIVNDQGKFLLIRESNLKFKNQWYLPGGSLEANEDITLGLVREVMEETGYQIGINGVCFFKYVDRPVSRKGLYIYCSARIITGEMKTVADEHSMEVGWFISEEILQLNLRGNLAELIKIFPGETPLLPTQYVQLNVPG